MSEQKPKWTLTTEEGKVVWRIPLPIYEGKVLVLDLSPAEADALGKKLQAYAAKCRQRKKAKPPVAGPSAKPGKAKPIRALRSKKKP